jgi:hypothetical protein
LLFGRQDARQPHSHDGCATSPAPRRAVTRPKDRICRVSARVP